MKKVIFGFIATILCVLPFTVNAAEKVKVYIFSKDGCTYCEKQNDYLKGLEGYNKTFEVVDIQIYDSNWKQTSNYELANKVVQGFNKTGISEDTLNLQGTPTVIISDVYAKTAYNANLESIINEVVKNGDKDIVGCYKDGKTDCLDHLMTASSNVTCKTEGVGGIIAMIIIFSLATLGISVAVSMYNKRQILEAINAASKKSKK